MPGPGWTWNWRSSLRSRKGIEYGRHQNISDTARGFRCDALGAERREASAGSASGPKPKVPAPARTDDKRRQKAMTALIPILACTLVFLLKNPLKVSPAAQSQQTPPSIAAGAVNLNPEVVWELPPLYPPGGRDPMRLPAPPAPTVEQPGAEPAPTRRKSRRTWWSKESCTARTGPRHSSIRSSCGRDSRYRGQPSGRSRETPSCSR